MMKLNFTPSHVCPVNPMLGSLMFHFTIAGQVKQGQQLETIEIHLPSFPVRKPRLPDISLYTNIMQLWLTCLTEQSVGMVALWDRDTVETCDERMEMMSGTIYGLFHQQNPLV